MPWVEPKTNWTKDDYYNAQDLNRVEANIEYLATIPDVFYPAPVLATPVKDRTTLSIEFYDGLNRAEGNIDKIRALLYLPSGWEPGKVTWKSGDKFDYTDAARLESNLLRLFNLIHAIKADFRYCGTAVCGFSRSLP